MKLFAYDDQPADDFGVMWGLTQLDGWDDGWEGSGATDQRSQADGAWISPQYASPRIIHLGGSIDADSWDAVTHAWNRWLAEIPFRSLAPLLVSVGEGTVPEQTALVRQHEKPILSRFDNRADFSLSLLAPDPRKYATSVQSVPLVLPILSGGIAPPLTPPITITGSTSLSQATLTNDGTVTTYPVFTLTGPCPPATILNLTTSEAIRVVDAVPAGQTLVIDVLAGTAVTGGQSRRVLGSWWGLEPGPNEIAFRADGYDAAAGLTISYRSAWK
ncbi:phage distal tail protein [Nocardioides sp. LHG3406-4]|uniref:phage distal tail protein n=1 Tax=Nocardioides sp. LHG3406-4 TaxID=2804575 RepID=UPI003CF55BA6